MLEVEVEIIQKIVIFVYIQINYFLCVLLKGTRIILIHSVHESIHFSQEQFFLKNASYHAPELQNLSSTKICKHL